jgi:hypothetical protein
MTLYWYSSQVSSLDNCVDDTPTETGLTGNYIIIYQGPNIQPVPNLILSNIILINRVHPPPMGRVFDALLIADNAAQKVSDSVSHSIYLMSSPQLSSSLDRSRSEHYNFPLNEFF